MIDGMEIRWMIRRDLPQVLRIERESFPVPWTEADFIEQLRQRHVIGLVATDTRDRIYGFALYGLGSQHLSVMNLAVDPVVRFQSVGRALVARLRSKLQPGRRERLMAGVCEDNLPAHFFWRSVGGRVKHILHGCYPPPHEHVATYVFELTARSEAPA